MEACSYIINYLSDRKQRVKIAHREIMKRGVPQGSLAGPLLVNIFINDYLLQLEKICRVYNYADDNTLMYANKDRTIAQNTLEHALEWFKGNFTFANPTKFKAMILGQPAITYK